MILSVVFPPLLPLEPPEPPPLEQAAATTVTATASEPIRRDRVLLR
jgi:hypothetical protein